MMWIRIRNMGHLLNPDPHARRCGFRIQIRITVQQNTTSLESRQPLPVPDPGSESALQLVLWIRIRMVSELLPGSGIKVPDQNPAKSERAYK